jgi:lipocalin
MSDRDAWQAEYERIARELVAAAARLGAMIEAPDTERLDADQFQGKWAEVDRLGKELQKHFGTRTA